MKRIRYVHYFVQEFMRVLGELEGLLEELDGWGQLLTKDCVKPDGQVIENRVDELRSALCIVVHACMASCWGA